MFRIDLSRRISEFLGVALFALALVWFISLATYSPTDAVWFFNTGGDVPPMNLVGLAGSFISEASYQVLGLTSYLLPPLLAVLGWYSFWCLPIEAGYTRLIGLVLMVACVSSLLDLTLGTIDVAGKTFLAGGYAGYGIAVSLASQLNPTGAFIIVVTLLALSVILSTKFSFSRFFSQIGQQIGRAPARLGRWRSARRNARQQRNAGNRKAARARASVDGAASPEPDPQPAELQATSATLGEAGGAPESILADLPLRAPEPPAGEASTDSAEPLAIRFDPPADQPAFEAPEPDLTPEPEPPPVQDNLFTPAREVALDPADEAQRPAAPAAMRRSDATFTHPPPALFDAAPDAQRVDERQLKENALLLEEKCREFSVEGSVVQFHPGPVVTTFELKPHAGVKYSRVTRLADDLCLAMKADSVLIERIPGKSTVGIQIPNAVRDQISLREMLESDAYRNSPSMLTLALGKSIHGEPVVADLATMPHLLVAGTTGSGKSVALNAMLTSILYRATPDNVRLILIDPKRLELGMYEDIPHLLTPVVVEPKKAANALQWAVRTMEERYKLLAAEGVRNIHQYNRNIEARRSEATPDELAEAGEDLQPLAQIVLTIDELSDLMMIAGNEVEEAITRLAQMARAIGIHLILATQRPSVDVITGLIKANFPSRIAFRVSSKVDSRTILDMNGAEQLLGRGDMLYLPPASSRTVRLHSPYISEQETARLAGFLRKQGKPNYDTTITEEDKPEGAAEFERDDLYDDAARIVVSSGHASISYLQRRLRVGFSRAARLVDMMEADGLVSSGASGKAREVLVKPDYFEQIDLQPR